MNDPRTTPDPVGRGPLVSVVIPNHNYARFVGEAVESALDQTYQNLEVIVVDNASTDDSLDVLSSFASRCRILSCQDPGQSRARNLGIRESNGELVAFLDADDAWLPTKIESQVALLRANVDVVLVYCGLMEADESLRPVHAVHARFRGGILEEFARHPGEAVVLGGESTALVRRTALDAAGPFDARLSISAGWDMWRRVAAQGRVEFVDEPLALYRQHGAGAHQRLPRYESDMRLANAKLFSDPQAAHLLPLRRQCLSRTDLMFAKAYLLAGEHRRAGRLLVRSIRAWPPVLGEVVGAIGSALGRLRTRSKGDVLARPPVAHRVARRLGSHGVRGGRLYWGFAAWAASVPGADVVEVEPGVPLSFDRADWIGLNAYRGLYERAEMTLVRQLLRPGDVVVDVGANIGYVAAIAAKAVSPGGRVLAFEPSGRCIPHLRASASSLPDRRVDVFAHALGGTESTALLSGHQRPNHSGLGTLRSESGATDGETVPVRRLDAVLSEEEVGDVTLLKIDVEGFEHAVLEGAPDLLDGRRARFVLMEVSPEFGSTTYVSELLLRLAPHYRAFAVGETGTFRRRVRLEPLTPAGAMARLRQFNLLLARTDSLDRIAGLAP